MDTGLRNPLDGGSDTECGIYPTSWHANDTNAITSTLSRYIVSSIATIFPSFLAGQAGETKSPQTRMANNTSGLRETAARQYQY